MITWCVFWLCLTVCCIGYYKKEMYDSKRRWDAHARQQQFWEMQQTNRDLAAMQQNGNRYVH